MLPASRGLKLGSQHPQIAHYCLSLQFPGIGHSSGFCGHAHTDTHTQEREEKIFFKILNQKLKAPGLQEGASVKFSGINFVKCMSVYF